MPNFLYPASLRRPLGADDAQVAARLLTRREPEATANDVAWLTTVLAAAYAPEGTDQAPLPGAAAFEAVIGHFSGRLVALSVQYFFWSGGGPGDRRLIAADLGDPEVVRHLAEAMGVGEAEEERDLDHRAWNAYISPASKGSQGVGGLGDEATGERIACERAEYDWLKRDQDEAAARMRGLQRDVLAAERGSSHGAEVFAGMQAAQEEYQAASRAAEVYLREHPDAVPVYAAARRFHALGIATVPPRGDGSKRPVGEWKEYQERLPTDEELTAWHQAGTSGLGIVTGRTDRDDGLGVEMFEPEGRAVSEGVFDEFLGYVAEAGLTGVWERIAAGYRERTPGGGDHYYWLCEEYSGNLKLAMRPATEEELAENPKDKYRTLLETRGKGGYSVAAPTPGSFHESGRPWTVGAGRPETLTVITPEQREGILRCARLCNKVPAGTIHEHPERARHETPEGPNRSPAGVPLRTRPGDVFNRRGPAWAELLEPHGWREVKTEKDGTTYWTRPGKAGGVSATTSNPQHDGDKLHIFTSSTEFEPDVAYSKFAVVAILEHGGDWSAAAAQLVRDGYVSDEAVCAVPPVAAEGTWAPPRDIPGAPGGETGGRIRLTNAEEIVLRLRWAIETGRLSDKLFLNSGKLVAVELRSTDEIATAEAGGRVMSRVELAPVTPELVQWFSAQTHLCYKEVEEKGKDGGGYEIPALPAAGQAKVALASSSYRHVPAIRGVTAVPLLKPSRTLLTSQGFDPESGLIYWPQFDIGEITVSRETVCEAKRFLKGKLLRDFPFVAPADRTNYLSMLFTPILRHFVRQLLSPLFVITATAAGSGKTYLVDIPKTLFGATVRPWVGDDAELRKAITATLIETNPIIVFDDVDRWDSVGSATFCKALTQFEWDDRLLGLNKEFHGRNDRAWVITGNNITLGGDVPDRADGLVRLDPRMPDPKNRPVAGFALGDLREWLKDPANCSLLLGHLLVLVLDWAQAGAQEKAYPSRFPKWASLMGGLLGHHDFTDFLGNADAIRADHTEVTRSLESLLARWYATYGSEPQRLRQVCQDRAFDSAWSDVWPVTTPRGNREPQPYGEVAMRRLLKVSIQGWVVTCGFRQLRAGRWRGAAGARAGLRGRC